MKLLGILISALILQSYSGTQEKVFPVQNTVVSVQEQLGIDSLYVIEGKWYIYGVINLESNDTINVTFIECPYLELRQDGRFFFENGIRTGRGMVYWSLDDSSLFVIDRESAEFDSTVFVIISHTKNYLSLTNQGKEFILGRDCDRSSNKYPKETIVVEQPEDMNEGTVVNQQTTLKQGEWVSAEDDKYWIRVDSTFIYEYYESELTETFTYQLSIKSCDENYYPLGKSDALFLIKNSGTESYCYEVTINTKDYISLIWSVNGSIMTFRNKAN